MKQDERLLFLTEKYGKAGPLSFEAMSLKRWQYLQDKWVEKGWLTSDTFDKTYSGRRIATLLQENNLFKYANKVVTIYWLTEDNYTRHPITGIFKYNDEYDYCCLYTIKEIKNCINFQKKYERKCLPHTHESFDSKHVAYIELVKNPQTIWRHFNYYAWKAGWGEDFFHNKYSFLYNSPKELIGTCTPQCQCQNF